MFLIFNRGQGHLVTIYDEKENQFVNEIANMESLGSYVAYPFMCEWEGDVPLQSDVKLVTNMGVKNLPKDFKFPITKTSGDYDKDTLSDWEEVDHNILENVGSKIYKSDLPLYLDYALRKGENSKNPFKKFTGNAYINNQLLQVKFLPVVSDPTSNDGDGDNYLDCEDKNPLERAKHWQVFSKYSSLNEIPSYVLRKDVMDKINKTYNSRDNLNYTEEDLKNIFEKAEKIMILGAATQAGANMKHYLKNTGEMYDINVEQFIQGSINARVHYTNQITMLIEHIESVYNADEEMVIYSTNAMIVQNTDIDYPAINLKVLY